MTPGTAAACGATVLLKPPCDVVRVTDDESALMAVVDAGGRRASTAKRRTRRWPRPGPARPSAPTPSVRCAAGSAWSSRGPSRPDMPSRRASGRPMHARHRARHRRRQAGHADEDRARRPDRRARWPAWSGRRPAPATPTSVIAGAPGEAPAQRDVGLGLLLRHRGDRGDPHGAAGRADGGDDASRRPRRSGRRSRCGPRRRAAPTAA